MSKNHVGISNFSGISKSHAGSVSRSKTPRACNTYFPLSGIFPQIFLQNYS
ncbi:hypothetical protein N9W06_03790 [Candidatus Marinimicrobia bacterium]|nr:hypothetical protein [Candidatus Neomarinimicrobiota bacterium]